MNQKIAYALKVLANTLTMPADPRLRAQALKDHCDACIADPGADPRAKQAAQTIKSFMG